MREYQFPLECTAFVRNGVSKESTDITIFINQKSRHNTPNRLELLKFYPYCYKHTIHREIKKIDLSKHLRPYLTRKGENGTVCVYIYRKRESVCVCVCKVQKCLSCDAYASKRLCRKSFLIFYNVRDYVYNMR
ncbi:putative ribosomal protein L33 [Helianthus anomalus]